MKIRSLVARIDAAFGMLSLAALRVWALVATGLVTISACAAGIVLIAGLAASLAWPILVLVAALAGWI